MTLEKNYRHRYKKNSRNGYSLVEVIIAMAFFSIIIFSTIELFIASRESQTIGTNNKKAANLAQEYFEDMKNIRRNGWNTISNGKFAIVKNAAVNLDLVTTTSGEVVNNFTRSITIEDAYRDINDKLTDTGGTVDPSTKKITVVVSWNDLHSGNFTQFTYLTRYFDNLAWLQTTQTEFNAGTKSNASVVATTGSSIPDDGQVQLGAGGGGGDWCQPSLSITSVDLSRQGIPTAIGAFSGNVVTGTGGNASGPTFVKTVITGNSPVVAAISGQFNNTKANSVFTETTYGYIATTNHQQEIQILDLSTASGSPPVYSLVGWFDAPGNGEGNSIFVAGNIGYMTSGSSFYTFNLSSRSGSRAQLNTATPITLNGTGNKIVVVGNYAYIAVNSTTTQLQIIDVTNPATPVKVASVNVGNNQPGIDVSVNSTGSRTYLITSLPSGNLPSMFIVNTSTKSGTLPLIGTGYNTGGMNPRGVAVTTGNRAIIVGTGGTYQYQVVDITDETNPKVCGSTSRLQINGGAYAVSTVLQNDGYAYAYIVTGDSHAELKIILGGAGGEYVNAGTYESATLDSGHRTSFNRFFVTQNVLSETTMKYQVAIKNPPGGNCTGLTFSSLDFVGPDGTSVSYFPADSAIPLKIDGTSYANPGQCFRFRAYLRSDDDTQTPVLYDFTVNYSP